MSHTYKTEGVHEFRDTGIILMKNSARFLGKWSLLFTMGKQEIMVFSDIHYMKHTTDEILLVTSTIDAIKSYTIRYEDHNLQVSSLDLYEWILSIVCPSVELPSVT
jgi:hypothetical protein